MKFELHQCIFTGRIIGCPVFFVTNMLNLLQTCKDMLQTFNIYPLHENYKYAIFA